MKKLRLILCLFVSLIPVFAAAACGGGAAGYAVPAYETDRKMDIGVWNIDPEQVEDLAEAGCNVALAGAELDFDEKFWTYSRPRAIEFMDRAQAVGVKVIVIDTAFCESICEYSLASYSQGAANKRNVHLYKEHPAFYGLFVSDEPFSQTYPRADAVAAVKRKVEEVRQEFPGKIPFVNLALWVSDTWAAVDLYMNEVKPELLSYDEYCINADKTIGASYLSNLARIKRTADASGVPAYSTLLTVGHVGPTKTFATPDYNTMRWQVACNQTFGYDGFWHYNGVPYGPTYDAIIKGSVKTQLYYDIKAVQTELRAWEHVYLSFKWQGIAAIEGEGHSSNPLFFAIADKTPKDKIPGIKKITNSEDILVGIFKDAQGRNGYMLTNGSNPWQAKNAYVNVTFKGYKGVQVWQDGAPRIVDLDKKGKASIELAPGQGKFLIPLKKAK